MTKPHKGSYRLEVPSAHLESGETVAMLRELKGWTQEKLAKESGIASTNISQIENGRLAIGRQRAISLAKAFGVHPATILFPDFPIQKAA